MTLTLPTLELKYTKVTEKNDTNTNTNTNTNSNTITNQVIINEPTQSITSQTTSTSANQPLSQSDSSEAEMSMRSTQAIQRTECPSGMPRSDSPLNIKQFKETLLTVLISYFKNNIVLLNNLVELSEKIITKLSDLTLLIALLLEVETDKITVELEEISANNCFGKVCNCFAIGDYVNKHLPRYRKINDIIIDKKQSFKIYYNQFYVQLQTEYNISLEYVLL
jgi:hypothetical protein